MFLSRAMTAPTCFRSQVARVATSRAICMKYWSQLARSRALMLDGLTLPLDHVRRPWLGPAGEEKISVAGSGRLGTGYRARISGFAPCFGRATLGQGGRRADLSEHGRLIAGT